MNSFLPTSFGDAVAMLCSAALTYTAVSTLFALRDACRAHAKACAAFVESTEIGGGFGPRRSA